VKKILEHTFQNRHFRPPKIRGFGLGRTGEKFADSEHELGIRNNTDDAIELS